MVSGKKSKAVRNARSVVSATKPKPWGTVAAVLAVVVFAGVVFGFFFASYNEGRAEREALASFTPSAANQDPSSQIQGVVTEEYQAAGHVEPQQQVAYQQFPPFGGPHDGIWAACNGVVYDTPVRNENMIHSLEHGAVWITYNPDQIRGDALRSLVDRVQGEPFTMLSPYPGLDSPISLQSWEHQLKLSDPTDPRIDQFIRALRKNTYTHPEPQGTCDVLPTIFDVDNPPPFNPEPPGPDAVPMDFAPTASGMGAAGQPAPPAGG